MSNRWQGDESEFSWERDALAHVKSIMPDRAPYAARQCFQFTGTNGRVWECDLLIAAPSGLYLIEIKSHRGRAWNRGSTWVFDSDGSINNPLHITNQKSKELRSRLETAARKRKVGPVPFITPIVFLSAADLVCQFDEIQRVGVYGREKLGGKTKLPEIGTGLLFTPPKSEQHRVTPAFAKHLPQLLTDIGVGKLRSGVHVGPYVLESKATDVGPTWSDYLAEHQDISGDKRRVRVYYAEQDDTAERRQTTRAVAQREYRATLGIHHDGIVQVDSFHDELDAGPAVVFRHGKDWQRLPDFMAEHGDDLVIDHRVDMIRQLVDALDHAHRNRLYHRALGARSILVAPPREGDPVPHLRIADWQTAGGHGGTGELPGLTTRNMTTLARHLKDEADVYLAPEVDSHNAEPAQLDVYGLGSIAYLLLTGQAPAADRGELIARLQQDGALVPSAVRDDLLSSVDDLVRESTAVRPADRLMDVAAFSEYLDLVEAELTDPDAADMPDPLTAKRGDVLGPFLVERVLGKGASARALLATDTAHDDRPVVLKIGLEGTDRERLEQEAVQLQNCRSSYIVERYDGPIKLGSRYALVLEPAGNKTLADYLGREGLTPGELEAWAEDLFAMLQFLEQKGIRHRDIKPANLGIQERGNKKRRQLVLFDFSLADVSEDNTAAGTDKYRDPFLGPPNRLRFDDAAERYSVAVTLHEMASRQLPIWGDGVVSPQFGTAEYPSLAEESFHPAIREGLVDFFHTALHRDHTRRHPDLADMVKGFRKAFLALDTEPPVTTAETVTEQSHSMQELRQRAIDAAQPETPLSAAGLSDRAFALAHDRLGVSTAGELARINPDEIRRLRGEGMRVRNELSRITTAWRQRFSLAERSPESAKAPSKEWDTATVDKLADQFVAGRGDEQQLTLQRLILALPDGENSSPLKPWSTFEQIAEQAEVSVAEVSNALTRVVNDRWKKSVVGVSALRLTVVELLENHGRVMSAEALARALLAVRGSDLTDPEERLNRASACLRVAYESDQRLNEPQLTYKRYPDGTVVFASVSADPNQPVESELIEYAEKLAARARELIGLGENEPLPSATRVRTELGAVAGPKGMIPLSDADMVRLAADLDPAVEVTPRLELYPVDLDPVRVVRLTNLALLLDNPGGVDVGKLRERVTARFPRLANFPEKRSDLLELLHRCGLKVIADPDDPRKIRLRHPVGTDTSRRSGTRSGGSLTMTPRAELDARLRGATRRGGFLAIRVNTKHALPVTERLTELPGVTPVDVSAAFLDALKSVWQDGGGKPPWQTVLAADRPDAPLKALRGLNKLLVDVWPRLADQVAELPGTVLLHDATPLARYSGGRDLLSSFMQAARQPNRPPHGLWLVCPMERPHLPAQLDDHLVGAIDSQGEQLTLSSVFTAGD
ncbi:serine/threonine protein kinase [Stackebrandtia albiflava]|uniref:non-specific serine/threonine protein kinase n=1 Tax=Stackebrandtia albiflava TaxID=406432 RepID=A0A562URH1_9ACTN|nr:BREX system serine/threonine kinase PglW [Stackebrandtia albiflava]TWJ08198.1 serine/threonine protein kinase [Stackebrandtia albiflava]